MTDQSFPSDTQADPLAGTQNPFDHGEDGIVDPQLYNTLMSTINAELTTEGLKTLDAKYKDETPEQAKQRAARYQKDFAEYDRLAQEQFAKMKSSARAYQRKAMQSLEHIERVDEQAKILQMEQAIADA